MAEQASVCKYKVGDKIIVKPSKKGQIIVVVDGGKGDAKHFAMGTWYGVRLTEKKGTCDGRYKNQDPYFFKGPMGFCVFVQSKLIVRKVEDDSFGFMDEEKAIDAQKQRESTKYDHKHSKMAALQAAFKKLDTDGSKTLEKKEFGALAVEQLGCDTETALKLFKQVDVSGNGSISFAEFDSWVSKQDDEESKDDESALSIVSIELYLVTIPLLHPYVCADCTLIDQANVICKINTTDPDISGYGESNPDEGFTKETPDSIWNIAKTKISALIMNKNALDIDKLENLIDAEVTDDDIMAKGMINMALWDIYGKYHKKPVYQCLADLYENHKVFNQTVPLLYPFGDQKIEEDELMMTQKMAEGYKTFMLKMGANQDIQYQLKRLKNIENKFGPIGDKVLIVTDANEGYSFEQSMEFIKGCKGLNVSFIEQPIPKKEYDNLKILKEECIKIGTDLSLDESVQSTKAIHYCLENKIGSVFSVKVSKNGGISKLYKVVKLCKQYGVKCCFNSMIEFGIAQSALLSVIAVTENIVNMGHCFMSVLRLKDDITDFKALISEDKVVSLSNKYGLGINIDPDKLATYSSKVETLKA
eukprot:625_1